MEETVLQKFLEDCRNAQTIRELLDLNVPVWRELNQDLKERGVSQEHRDLFFKMKTDTYYRFKEENKLDEPLSKAMKRWIEAEVEDVETWYTPSLARRIIALKLMICPNTVHDGDYTISPELTTALFDIERPGQIPTPEQIKMYQVIYHPIHVIYLDLAKIIRRDEEKRKKR